MKLKKNIPTIALFFYFGFFSNIINAQLQPSFFIKKKSDGLQSNVIYNIHTAKNGLIYIAHSKGISSFDGNFFKNYPNKNAPYTELTNILETSNGEIYCKSFNNTLFKIVGDSVEKVAYYPSDYGYVLSTCYRNTIISMSGDTIFFYDAANNMTIKKNIKNVSNEQIPDKIIFGGYSSISGVFYQFFVDERFNIHKTRSLGGKLYHNQEDCYLIMNKSIENIYHVNKKELLAIKSLNNNSTVNYITSTDSIIWVCTTDGVYYYNEKKGISTAQYFLKGYNVTDVNKTFENNYAISTIGQGLIFVPNFEVIYLPNTPAQISEMFGLNNNLYLGTKQGTIYQYNLSTYSNSLDEKLVVKNSIDYLLYDKFSKSLVYSTPNSNITLIKDHTYIDDELVLATNGGIYIYVEKPIKSWLKNYVITTDNFLPKSKKISFLNNQFVSTISYNAGNHHFFVNTNNGIFELIDGQAKPKQLPELKCVLTDIECYNGLLYLATKDQGILTWDGKKYQALSKNNPTNDILLKIETYENELWVLGENAVYCYSDNVLKKYDKQFGIDVENVLNIQINKNYVFLNNGESIVQFHKNVSSVSIDEPRFLLNSIVSRKQKKAIQPNTVLSYDDNVLTINFSLIAFANAQNTHLTYTINDQEIIHLQNNIRQISLNNLTPDDYVIRFFIVNNNIVNDKSVHEFKFTIKPPFYKTWWFNSIILLSSLLLAYFIFNRILTRWKKDTLLKESKLMLEKELDKSMLTSIKAQMNPHFLFNALNTIQSYIYSNDKQNASVYISKFSDLTRSILDMSTKETIALEEEINSLRLYLELEKMRFEDSFNYKIHVSSSLSKEQTKIPSMLVQPYIENAIKHGLLHKKTNRELTLNFEKENTYLIIKIDDNGIGRKKSEELNKIKNRQHTSFAMNANKKRIDILKNTYKEIDLQIIDKYSDLGEPSGTKVIIKLPL